MYLNYNWEPGVKSESINSVNFPISWEQFPQGNRCPAPKAPQRCSISQATYCIHCDLFWYLAELIFPSVYAFVALFDEIQKMAASTHCSPYL